VQGEQQQAASAGDCMLYSFSRLKSRRRAQPPLAPASSSLASSGTGFANLPPAGSCLAGWKLLLLVITLTRR
jgi:hypothetical protein